MKIDRKEKLPPGLRNGYSRISNEILENLMYADLTKREYKICLCILRYGYGYKKEKSEIRGHQRTIAKLTGLNEVVIKYSLTLLKEKNIIEWSKLNKTLSFNRHIDTWKLNKTLSLEERKLNKTLSKNLMKREVKTKRNVKLDTPRLLPIKKQRAPKERVKKEKERSTKEIKTQNQHPNDLEIQKSEIDNLIILYKDKFPSHIKRYGVKAIIKMRDTIDSAIMDGMKLDDIGKKISNAKNGTPWEIISDKWIQKNKKKRKNYDKLIKRFSN